MNDYLDYNNNEEILYEKQVGPREINVVDNIKNEAHNKASIVKVPEEVGPKGDDGYTPVRGTDYWTDTDKAEMEAYIDQAIEERVPETV